MTDFDKGGITKLTTKPACKNTLSQVRALQLALSSIANWHLEMKVARGLENKCREISLCECDFGKAYRTIEAMGVTRMSDEFFQANGADFPF